MSIRKKVFELPWQQKMKYFDRVYKFDGNICKTCLAHLNVTKIMQKLYFCIKLLCFEHLSY